MAKVSLTKAKVEEAKAEIGATGKEITEVFRNQTLNSGRLPENVDPRYNLIRKVYLPEDERSSSQMYAVPCETLMDTTGSEGKNVDNFANNLVVAYNYLADVLPQGSVLKICASTFGDGEDRFPFQCGSFASDERTLINNLARLYPEKMGGDGPEDPQYGLLYAAYLTLAEVFELGIKGYHFTVTDAPAHGYFKREHIEKIYGNDVFRAFRENLAVHRNTDIFCMEHLQHLKMETLVADLKRLYHAFVILTGDDNDAWRYWCVIYGKNRVFQIPSIEFLPQVEAGIIALTEGTRKLDSDFRNWLKQCNERSISAEHGMLGRLRFGYASKFTDSLMKRLEEIPYAAQRDLREACCPQTRLGSYRSPQAAQEVLAGLRFT